MAATLITEKLVLGQQHSTLKHLAVTLITVGIMMYTFASRKQVPENVSILDYILGKTKFSYILPALLNICIAMSFYPNLSLENR